MGVRVRIPLPSLRRGKVRDGMRVTINPRTRRRKRHATRPLTCRHCGDVVPSHMAGCHLWHVHGWCVPFYEAMAPKHFEEAL